MSHKHKQLILDQAQLVCSSNYNKPYSPKELENAFITDNFSERASHLKKTINLGLLIFAIYAIAEFLNIGEGALKVLILRICVIIPIVLIAFRYFLQPKFIFWQDKLIACAAVLIFLLALPGRYIAFQQGLIYYYYSYLILLCYINIIIQPKFFPALISSSIICLGALIFFYWIGMDAKRFIFVVNESIFFTALSLAANYYIQVNLRNSYARQILQKNADLKELSARQRLFDLSNIDSLTQLNNRHYLETYRSDYSKLGTGVLFIDIDNFKSFNDTYGHIAGDETLQQVANTLKNSVRKDDLLVRYGGEEFLILMKETSPETLLSKAINIKNAVQSLNIVNDKSDYGTITVSIGWCTLSKDDDLGNCMQLADQCLYKAKASGRNQIYPPTL